MTWWSGYLAYDIIGWGIRATMLLVILRRQMTTGASLAWLGIIFLHPYIGLILYTLLGESRLGPRRTQEHQNIISDFRGDAKHPGRTEHLAATPLEPRYTPVVLEAEHISKLPALDGNSVRLFADTNLFVQSLANDINSAKESVHLLYYMFVADSSGEIIIAALKNAAGRGVKCRLLVDGLASRVFLRQHEILKSLKSAGVEVAAALPVALIRRRFARLDMRNHRKLAIIDGQIGYTGSHNLINADYGGRRGNPWFDITGRFTGPAVGELAGVFAEDWAFETGEQLPIRPVDGMLASAGADQVQDFTAQVVPTGPTMPGGLYRRLLIAALQSAKEQVILTSPYFVPDEPTILAMMMAADRGVKVKLIVPKSPDHYFTAAAGRAHFQALLAGGIHIYQFRPGLVHAKTITVDDAFGILGTANLDLRSFMLNFELSVVLYGKPVTEKLRSLQLNYLAESDEVIAEEWAKLSSPVKYLNRVLALFSPLL
jgi:cardiolipin synthase